MDALLQKGNTLGVAPTGSGKTIMLSAVVGKMLNGSGEKACVLGHRDEITSQNLEKFTKVNPDLGVSVVDAGTKSWDGDAVFAMVQTLSREKNLANMPALKLLVVDEAHHVQAETYKRIIAAAKEKNPSLKLYGVTATPNRGDGKTLRGIFDNCADQITLKEMIDSGYLVRPRTFVLDLGVQDALRKVPKLADEFDMNKVAEIMDKSPITAAILKHWKEKAGDRRTVVFCSTVAHAVNVLAAYLAHEVKAELVTGDTPDDDREQIFERLDSGETQVLVNVAVATEGWDCPPVSCVVLLRPCSHKSTMIQMIGRGLRKIDPELYPGIVKTDCLVMDFGASAVIHGTLEQEVNLNENEVKKPGLGPVKTCPECHAEVPARSRFCPFCEYEFQSKLKDTIKDFVMTEIDLLRRSSFLWCDIFGNGNTLIATGFEAWGGVFWENSLWCALGGISGGPVKILHVGDKISSLGSADDWMNSNETEEAAHKSRRWLREPPSLKQLQYLNQEFKSPGLTRYKASCLLSFQFNWRGIGKAIAQVKSSLKNKIAEAVA